MFKFQLWLSFVNASEEDQERFLLWGRRFDKKQADGHHRRGGDKEDPRESRPSVAPRKAFNLISKKLRRQLVHGHIRLADLAVLEEDIMLSFFARYPRAAGEGDGPAVTAGARSLGFEDEFSFEVSF